MKKDPSRNREKFYITISPSIKEKTKTLANMLDISSSQLIENSLKYYMEKKYEIPSTPTAEEIQKELAKLRQES